MYKAKKLQLNHFCFVQLKSLYSLYPEFFLKKRKSDLNEHMRFSSKYYINSSHPTYYTRHCLHNTNFDIYI